MNNYGASLGRLAHSVQRLADTMKPKVATNFQLLTVNNTKYETKKKEMLADGYEPIGLCEDEVHMTILMVKYAK